MKEQTWYSMNNKHIMGKNNHIPDIQRQGKNCLIIKCCWLENFGLDLVKAQHFIFYHYNVTKDC